MEYRKSNEVNSKMSKSQNYFLKVLILGDPGVGKTALMNRFAKNTFSDSQYKPTLGADFLTKEIMIGNKSVMIQIWDTAGQERFSSLVGTFYRGADCALLVYDINNIDTFKSLETWMDEFHVKACTTCPDRFPFAVLGNKADLKNREVSLNRVHLWCQSKNDIPYFETSAKDSTNVDQAFELLIKTCITFKAPERDELTQNVHIRPKETDSGRKNQICSRC